MLLFPVCHLSSTLYIPSLNVFLKLLSSYCTTKKLLKIVISLNEAQDSNLSVWYLRPYNLYLAFFSAFPISAPPLVLFIPAKLIYSLCNNPIQCFLLTPITILSTKMSSQFSFFRANMSHSLKAIPEIKSSGYISRSLNCLLPSVCTSVVLFYCPIMSLLCVCVYVCLISILLFFINPTRLQALGNKCHVLILVCISHGLQHSGNQLSIWQVINNWQSFAVFQGITENTVFSIL